MAPVIECGFFAYIDHLHAGAMKVAPNTINLETNTFTDLPIEQRV